MAVSLALVALAAAGQESAAASGPWRADNPPQGPSPIGNEFRGIAAIPGTSGFWAVGWRLVNGKHQTLIERRTVTGWERVPSPSFPNSSQLNGVVARSADAAWAVGERRRPGNSGYRPIVLRWNGTAWRQVAVAKVAGSSELAAVTILGGGRVMVVGTTRRYSLVERWNGVRFVDVPITSSIPLSGIAAGRDGGLWAVSPYGRILHRPPRSSKWHGASGHSFGHYRPDFSSVLVTGPGTTVWVFGERFTTSLTFVAVIERYQHGIWNVVNGLPGGEDVTSATRLGATGFLAAGAGATGAFVWSDDGTTLTAMTVPQPVNDPKNARIIGIARAGSGIAEFAGWRDVNCSAPCQSGVFPFAERNP
jgi:hypothetical protein